MVGLCGIFSCCRLLFSPAGVQPGKNGDSHAPDTATAYAKSHSSSPSGAADITTGQPGSEDSVAQPAAAHVLLPRPHAKGRDESALPVSTLVQTHQGQLRTALPASQRVWSDAYERIEKDNRELLESYLKVLEQVLGDYPSEMGGGDIVAEMKDPITSQEHMRMLLEKGRKRISTASKITTRIGELAGFLLSAKGMVDVVLQSIPQAAPAALPWAGVCVGLEILQKPSKATASNLEGIAHVISRMNWYCALAEHLLNKDNILAGNGFEAVLHQLEEELVDLYEALLLYQIKSVCSYYRHQGIAFLRGLLNLDDWDGDLKPVINAEATVRNDAVQYIQERSKEALSGVLNAAERMDEHLGDIHTVLRRMVSLQEDTLDQKIREWISSINFATKQADMLARRQQGTGEWILKATEFQAWLNNNGKTLWCPGLPGAGKTVLASYLIDFLEKTVAFDNRSILYIYCSYKDRATQTDSNLLSSLLRQLTTRQGHISPAIYSCYRRHVKSNTRPTPEEWAELLGGELEWLQRTYIVVDALDECNEKTRISLLEKLRGLPKVNILVTSRPNLAIRQEFAGAQSVEIRATDEDLRQFVKGRAQKEPRIRCHIKEDPDMLGEVEAAIVVEAQGMFLVAELHMDALARKHTRWEVRDALNCLPQGLDEIYDNAMERIKDQGSYDSGLANKVLAWISFALRPLAVLELQHALGVTLGDPVLRNDCLTPPEVLVSICSGLVTIDELSGIIRLVHYTTQEYFVRVRQIQFPDAPKGIAAACLAYLDLNEFGKGPSPCDDELQQRLDKYHFLEYAAKNWGYHAEGDPEDAVRDDCLRLLTNDNKLLSTCQVMRVPTYRYRNYSQVFPRQVTAVHIAAHFGLSKILHTFVNTGNMNADARDNDSRTPLTWAAINGQVDAVRVLLLEGHVDKDHAGNDSRTPLSWAAAHGDFEIVRLLVSNGAHGDLQDNEGRTPLAWAAMKGHKDVVKILLDSGNIQDLDVCDHTYGRSPLLWAARYGHSEIVQLLLACPGVDIHAADTAYGQTSLMFASEMGYIDVVKILLEHEGHDVDRPDDTGESALITATRGGYDQIVELLLRYKGVYVAEDPDSSMLISWASEASPAAVEQAVMLAVEQTDKGNTSFEGETTGTFPVQRLLMRIIGDPNANRSCCESLVIWAAKNGQIMIAKHLKGHLRFPWDFKDRLYGRTPLAWAAYMGHTELARYLIGSREVDINLGDSCGQSPLSLAAERGHEGVVALLLAQKDIEADSKDILGRQPLSFAGGNGHDGIVDMLLERADVDVNMTDNYKETALSWASETGQTAAVRLLLQHENVRIDTRNVYGRSPFSLAVGKGHEDIVKMFLDQGGVDVTSRDTKDRTPLSWAVANGQEATALVLREYLATKGIREE